MEVEIGEVNPLKGFDDERACSRSNRYHRTRNQVLTKRASSKRIVKVLESWSEEEPWRWTGKLIYFGFQRDRQHPVDRRYCSNERYKQTEILTSSFH